MRYQTLGRIDGRKEHKDTKTTSSEPPKGPLSVSETGGACWFVPPIGFSGVQPKPRSIDDPAILSA